METSIVVSLTVDELRELVTSAVRSALDEWETARQEKALPEKWLTRQEAAELLHVAMPTLREYEKRKELCPSRIGRRVLYSRSEVDRVLSRVRTGGGSRR